MVATLIPSDETSRSLISQISGWSPTENNVVAVLCTHTFVKVQWQDGKISEYIPAVQLIPRDNLLDSDFYPGDFVVLKSDNLSNPGPTAGISQGKVSEEKVGFIMNVDNKERTAMVQWLKIGDEQLQKGENQGGNQEQKQLPTETISVYDLSENTGFEYRLSSTGEKEIQEENKKEFFFWFLLIFLGVVISLSKNLVGEVVDLQNGKVSVKWAISGEISDEPPDTLIRVEVDEEEEEEEEDYDSNEEEEEEDEDVQSDK